MSPPGVPFGPYFLEERIGQGGVAEVFRARAAGAQGIDKVLCVKRLLARHRDNHSLVSMFLQEAKLSTQLAHPNIVSVFAVGEVGGELYLAMELVRGFDLRAIQSACERRGRALPPSVAAYIAREICRGLGYAHDFVREGGTATPIIHRDVSPHNVLVSLDGIVKLCDFGVAKALEAGGPRTEAGLVKGKLAYLAPEIISGAPASPATDLFAAGIVLHEMLTGERLFKAGNDAQTIDQVQHMDIAAPSASNRLVPPALDAIALRALQRNPARRYGGAAEMARELDRHCAKARFGEPEMKRMIALLGVDRGRVAELAPAPEPVSDTIRSTVPDAPNPKGRW